MSKIKAQGEAIAGAIEVYIHKFQGNTRVVEVPAHDSNGITISYTDLEAYVQERIRAVTQGTVEALNYFKKENHE